MSPYVRTSGIAHAPALQIAALNQAAPVQNTWYTVANLRDVRLNRIHFTVQTTGETLELELTIDGVMLGVVSQAVAAGAGYTVNEIYLSWDGTHYFVVSTTNNVIGDIPFFECQSLLVRIRKTTNTGAGNLRAAVSYNQY